MVLPERLFTQSQARVAGSEEANPNDPKEWSRYQDRVGPGEYQPVQDMVEKDQQEMKKAKNSSEDGPIPIS